MTAYIKYLQAINACMRSLDMESVCEHMTFDTDLTEDEYNTLYEIARDRYLALIDTELTAQSLAGEKQEG